MKRRLMMASAAVAAVSVALATTSGTAALASGGSTPIWGAPTALPSGIVGIVDAAACPSADVCVVSGETDPTNSASLPEVAAEHAGAWGVAGTMAISGVSSENAPFTSISCMSASACVGVGYDASTSPSTDVPFGGAIAVSGTAVTTGVGAIVTLPGNAATPEQGALTSVSCTASSCTAVGFYMTTGNIESAFMSTYANGGWSVGAAVTAPSAATKGANLMAVSCPSTGSCEAVGDYLDASTDQHSWAIQLGGGTPQLLPTPSNAVAHSGTLPNVPAILDPSSAEVVDAISCPSADACTAAGRYDISNGDLEPMVIGISNGAPGAPVELSGQGAAALTFLTSIWCADAGDCALIGDTETVAPLLQPVTASEAAGNWSSLAAPPGSAPVAATSFIALVGLGCTSLQNCITPGVELSGSGYTPMAAYSALALSVTTASLPAATAGVPYSTTLQGAGGAGTGAWTVTSGSLPPGLSLNAASGVISGTPVVPGPSTFIVQLASAGPPAQTATAALSINVAAVPKVSAAVAKITASGVALTIGCSGSGTCSGTAVVTAVERLTGKRATAVTARAKPKRKKVAITLARGSYSLSAGQVAAVNLKLSAQAKTLLKQLHKISGTLTITATGAGKPTLTRTVTFKSAAKKKKKKKR
jgi:hypothetical protein